MSSTGPLYSAVIPGMDYGKTVSFYILASDVFGQSSTYGSVASPQTYNVVDTIDPTIGVTGPAAGSQLIGLVRFNVSAADSESGIANVTFLVDGSKVDMSTVTPWIYEWNTGSVANGLHTIRFTAEDKAGNLVSVSLQYDVENPQGIYAAGYFLETFVAQYGVFLGIAVVLVLAMEVRILIARRQSK
jgi:hypothetical protein